MVFSAQRWLGGDNRWATDFLFDGVESGLLDHVPVLESWWMRGFEYGWNVPDVDLKALSIQQPWAELILSGQKTVEIRTFSTTVRGWVYLYSGRRFSPLPCTSAPYDGYNPAKHSLPSGCVVGAIEILDCRASRPDDALLACVPAELVKDKYSWILGDVQRCPQLWPALFPPFGPWFYPFKRRGH